MSEPSICCAPTGSTQFLRLKSRSASSIKRKWYGAHCSIVSLRFSMRGNRRRCTSGSTRSAGNVDPNRATHSLLRAAASSESTCGM